MISSDAGSGLLILTLVFWISSFLVIYPYIVYPLVLLVCNRLSPTKPVPQETRKNKYKVSFIISAYNEEEIIDQKLKNTLDLDYPSHLINIYVVSDASDDTTDQIVQEWSEKDSRVALVRQAQRKGKTAGLNEVMSIVDGDIIIFSDANAMYESNAVNELIIPFVDEGVGYVVGSALYIENVNDASQVSEGLYWKYELWIKKLESEFHSVVGGDGAIYAIRKDLFWPLKDTDINDFVNPMQIISKGYRGIFTDSARCFEEASDEFRKEFRRKRRIVNRSWRAVLTYAGELDTSRHLVFLFMLFSHKVIRWFSVLFVAFALVSLGLLISQGAHGIYTVFCLMILSSIIAATIGWILDSKGHSMPKVIYIVYYFYLVGVASLLGIWDNARGLRFSTWGHIRN